MGQSTFRLPKLVVRDTLAFRREVERFVGGEVEAAEFHTTHVTMGIYEQREQGTYMVRVRGAAGVFLPHQVKLIAELSEKYGDGVVHATTRQDLQLHGVTIEDAPAVVESLLDVGLASRGGGGNTVRNVTACPRSGVCPNERFDVTPYALALTEFLLGEPNSFTLPRKFKVAFSGCANDCALASIADLGFFAHLRNDQEGFSVYAAGGLGRQSSPAIRIEEFISAADVFAVTEAVKRVFDKHGDRTNRARARLRYVVERVGEDEFRRMYVEELERVRQEGVAGPAVKAADAPSDADLQSVPIRLKLGNVSAHSLRQIALVAENLTNGTVRTTQNQDLLITGIPAADTQLVVTALSNIDPSFADRHPKCVACVGAAVCRTGLCRSGELAEAIESEMTGLSLPWDVTIRVSGCPNACAQHPIATLGFSGRIAIEDGERKAYYEIVAGGRMAEGDAKLAESVGRVRADAVPGLVREFWSAALKNAREGESLDSLMERWGIEYLFNAEW